MSRRNYQRPIGKRKLKRLFVLSTEGSITEPQYFGIFNNDTTVLQVKVLKHKGSAPEKVLHEMEQFLRTQDLRKNDEAWLVVDKDSWTDAQLNLLHQWSLKNAKYNLAVSNPKFEYWLLLHFEEGNGVSSSQNCSNRLKKVLPKYDKCIHANQVLHGVEDAVLRAKRRDTPPCRDWPRNVGTTVYKLVSRII